METTRSFAAQALALSVQDWHTLYTINDDDEDYHNGGDIAADSDHNSKKERDNNNNTNNTARLLDRCVHHVTSLLLVRIVAIQLYHHIAKEDGQNRR